MTNKLMVIRYMILIIFSFGFFGCGTAPTPTPQEMDAFIDTKGKTRNELIAEFKRQFEGKCVRSVFPFCFTKIDRVTSDGFYYREDPDKKGEVKGFYKFSDRPRFEVILGDYYLIWIYYRTYNSSSLIIGSKDTALRIYGLLESIYQTYQGQ